MVYTPLADLGVPAQLAFPSMLGKDGFVQLGYRLIEIAAAHLVEVRDRPPYCSVPAEDRLVLTQQTLPEIGRASQDFIALFEERVQPYPTFGIGHPRGFGWISGGADPLAVFGSLLFATLNPNCIWGDQSATYMKRL